MLKDIDKLINVVDSSIKWANDYGKDTFPKKELKEYRRKLRKYASSLALNCSMAAYGESQVGKSYLMSSLLSTPDKPFVIENKGRQYSFIDDLNPSGGNNSKTESTGVVTRFTLHGANPLMKDYVMIRNLSVADLVMLIADAYYNDLKIDVSNVLQYDEINNKLEQMQGIWADKSYRQDYLTDDDVKDICDYIKEQVGGMAASFTQSGFSKIVPEVIAHIKPERWVDVFSLLWNENPELSRLFSTLINEYQKLDFKTVVYVPFEAVMREKGTLLKINWLDGIFGNVELEPKEVPYTDVYDKNEQLLAADFPKSILSALIAELTFVLPPEIAAERKFLEKVDLLDFPGARSREKFEESKIQSVVPQMLRRGKVAYLFNKYARALNISGLLFCHHNDQKTESTLGNTVSSWIDTNIGRTPEERAENLRATNGISPLFFVATKFNIELEHTKNDVPSNPDALSNHWARFKTVYPEMLKTATWLDKWVTKGGIFSAESFQHFYLLRDFYWSGKNNVFDGYSDKGVKSPETAVHEHAAFPQFLQALGENFTSQDFAKKHFRNPHEAWESVASLNRDGSREIIRDLTAISGTIDGARAARYLKEIKSISQDILNKLQAYYEPEDVEQNNEKVRSIIRDISLSLDSNVGARPETFGKIIDQMMIVPADLRKIAYDIAVLHSERPVDTDEIILIRTMAGIEPSDSPEQAIAKLCEYYLCDSEEDLRDHLAKQELDYDTLVGGGKEIATTVADIISNRILEHWVAHINQQTASLAHLIPHSDEVAFMLQTLCLNLGVKKRISDKIDTYTKVFKEDDLPNAIADFASLTLNNFVSSVGSEYLSEQQRLNIEQKARTCRIRIDTKPLSNSQYERPSLAEALKAFDDAKDLGVVHISTLMKLPFWNNFQKWKSNLIRGLLCVSDISHVDPVANKALKKIIDNCVVTH